MPPMCGPITSSAISSIDDLIVAIAPHGKRRVLAESGLQGYAETDDHRRSPNYFRSGETLEKISKPEDLPLEARLSDKNDGTVLRPDGYSYGIEKAKTPQEPDRLVRVGDPGKSSLRADATQVRIADLPVHDVSGYLAFGPQGQLVFSAEAGIYLVRPSN